MIRTIFLLSVFILSTQLTIAQNTIEWSPDYRLTIEDFQATASNNGQMQTATGSFYVSYEMGGINLITTRNLNKNVSCYFQKDASYFDKRNEEANKRLLKYQQLIFNLYELQARNLRKKFFEERKHLLTKGPSGLHREALKEHNRLIAEVESDTFHGAVSEEIEKWNKWTLQEIKKLNDFCKDCKPSKKKKKK